MRALVRFMALLATILFVAAGHAAEWTPPPLDPQYGHVKDEAGVLTPEQIKRLDAKLDRARRDKGFAIVVYILPALPEGLSIEDVGYKAGNTWKVGSEKGDDGVILIATITDRHLRIETGKGVGGNLTDIGASRINREVIGPLMKQGLYYEAMNRGTDAILKEMSAGGISEAGREPQKRAPQQAQPQDWLRTGIAAVIIVLVIIGAIVSPTFRQILFFMLLFGRGGGGRGGGGGGGGGGSGYGGGGGSFGGGGSSDDY